MPLEGSISNRIREFHTGKTYERTKARYGKKAADRQAVAVAYSSKRRGKKRGGRR